MSTLTPLIPHPLHTTLILLYPSSSTPLFDVQSSELTPIMGWTDFLRRFDPIQRCEKFTPMHKDTSPQSEILQVLRDILVLCLRCWPQPRP